MNNPVHTTSDGRQLQRTFYTPYFMDALTGRNKDNYSPINKPVSEGMANVGNFFGRYNLYLDMAKPPSEYDQSWINAANNSYLHNRDNHMAVPYSNEFKSNMLAINPWTDPTIRMNMMQLDPDPEVSGLVKQLRKNSNQRQPSRLDYIPSDEDDTLRNYIIHKRKQRDVKM